MALTRREFLKWSGTAGAAAAAMCLGFDLRPVKSYAAGLQILEAKETTTICPYCAVGCGLIVHTKKAASSSTPKATPDHPINEGALCAKGAALYQMTDNKNRKGFPSTVHLKATSGRKSNGKMPSRRLRKKSKKPATQPLQKQMTRARWSIAPQASPMWFSGPG